MKQIRKSKLAIIILLTFSISSAYANNQNDTELDSGQVAVLLLGIGAVIYSATLESYRNKDVYRLIENLDESKILKNDRINLRFFPSQINHIDSFEADEKHFVLKSNQLPAQFNLLEIKLNLN